MLTRTFKDKELSLLGFGLMRLPQKDGKIDGELVEKMADYALSHGVNYFDTAVPYHAGLSEKVIGDILKKYPRESFYLADKFPGHQIAESYDPAAVFEAQLKKCGVEYFDFYLLHNVYENSIHTYLDKRWQIPEYFIEQKKLGRIKHLGFSTHGGLDVMEKWLSLYGEHMEFCQIQLNYLDWTLQQGKEKVALLNKHNIPIWVMEPVRGGKLCDLPREDAEKLLSLRPDETQAAWGFRFLQDVPGVTMLLSGMSNMAQMEDNVKTFSTEKPLTAEEKALVLSVAEKMKASVPCTSCRYCTDGCPMELEIPKLLSILNEVRIAPSVNAGMRVEAMERKPKDCISCYHCSRMCPQHIDIPAALRELDGLLGKIPSWADISRQREEEYKRSLAE